MGFNAETLEHAVQGEPDWLLDRRRTALSSFERLPLPSRTDEVSTCRRTPGSSSATATCLSARPYPAA